MATDYRYECFSVYGMVVVFVPLRPKLRQLQRNGNHLLLL